MRQFVSALVYEAESGSSDKGEMLDAAINGRTHRRTPDSDTGRYAEEASEEYDRNAEDIESGRMKHISEPTHEGALNGLARTVSRSRGFDDDNAEPISGDELLDRDRGSDPGSPQVTFTRDPGSDREHCESDSHRLVRPRRLADQRGSISQRAVVSRGRSRLGARIRSRAGRLAHLMELAKKTIESSRNEKRTR